MLNELLTLKRGAEAAGIELEIRHPDIKDSRNIPTFVVTLDEKGRAIGIRIKPTEITPWTCLLYTSPSPRDRTRSRMPSSA